MPAEIQESYRFNSKIKSLGQQERTDGWTMSVEWRLPDSDYALVLYGRDWDDLGGLQVGDYAEILIKKGQLKKARDGQPQTGEYHSHFFWNPTFTPLPDGPAPSPGAYDEGNKGYEGDQEHQTPPPLADDRQTQIWIGQATNIAAEFLTKTTVSLNAPFPLEQLRQLRDHIVHKVMKVAVAPEHFCYVHGAVRHLGADDGRWVHLVDRDMEQPCFQDSDPRDLGYLSPEETDDYN